MADQLGELMRRMGGTPRPNEQEFQTFMAFDPKVRAWRNGFQNKFGEPPNTENDPTFDYRAAYAQGNRPQAYAHDTMPHWDSRGKAPNHATAWMNDFMQKFGVDPNELHPNDVTPEMQQFMRGPIGGAVFNLGGRP